MFPGGGPGFGRGPFPNGYGMQPPHHMNNMMGGPRGGRGGPVSIDFVIKIDWTKIFLVCCCCFLATLNQNTIKNSRIPKKEGRKEVALI